jgi:hypothetical protein
MDVKLKEKFLGLWEKYFAGAELPLAYFYTDGDAGAELVKPAAGWSCFIGTLVKARKGAPLRFNADSFGCPGGKRYTGFTTEMRDGMEYFLSTGIKGVMDGERYKKTPKLAKALFDSTPMMNAAPAKHIVFKRWDALDAADEPAAVVFFATPDVLAGIFTLANFDRPDHFGVISPFSAGCGSIIGFPMCEAESEHPRAVLGMFDVSARPCVQPGVLSIAVPMKKFETMIGDMDESFLITKSWEKVLKRREN